MLVYKDINQTKFYTKLIDNQLRQQNHNKTVGLLIVKKKDKYVIEYATDQDIYLTNYKILNKEFILNNAQGLVNIKKYKVNE